MIGFLLLGHLPVCLYNALPIMIILQSISSSKAQDVMGQIYLY